MNVQTLKGFRDFLPSEMRVRQGIFHTFRTVFEQFGYEPLETPTLEQEELLSGKYGEEGEMLMYRFTDHGGRNVAMKYDLTVPASRVYAQYRHQLPKPFKRYQIQPVWRAENTQKGRFREFYQCDADVFGLSSPLADAEFIQMVDILITQLNLGSFIIRVNNRKITNALVQALGADKKQFIPIVTAIDKLEKIGVQGVSDELEKRDIPSDISKKLIAFISEISDIASTEALLKTHNLIKHIPEGKEGIEELETIFSYLSDVGVPDTHVRYDVSIVRGLSYYTGPVWETTIIDGNIGSVSGCGRYDRLVGSLLGTDEIIPATGGSFGIERIIQVMMDRHAAHNFSNPVQTLVTIFDDHQDTISDANRLVTELRHLGISSELWLQPGIKLEKQLKYADVKGISFALIVGPDERKENTVTIKHMKEKKQQTVSRKTIGSYFASNL